MKPAAVVARYKVPILSISLYYFSLSQPALPRERQLAQLPVQPLPFLRMLRTARRAQRTSAAKSKRSASPIAAPAYTIKSAMRNTTKATTHATAHWSTTTPMVLSVEPNSRFIVDTAAMHGV